MKVARRLPVLGTVNPGRDGPQVALAAWLRYRAGRGVGADSWHPAGRPCRGESPDPEQLDTLDAAGAAVSGQRYAHLTWVSAGRE